VQPRLDHGQIVHVWHRRLLPIEALAWTETGRPFDPEHAYNAQFSKIVGRHFQEMSAALSDAVTGSDAYARGDAARAWTELGRRIMLPSFEEALHDKVLRRSACSIPPKPARNRTLRPMDGGS
jgi:hypothetical protein